MKKLLLFVLVFLALDISYVVLKTPNALGAPAYTLYRSIFPETTHIYELGTSTRAWKTVTTDQLCLNGTCATSFSTATSSGTLTFNVGNGFLYPATTTDYIKASYFTATTTNATSTFTQFTAGTTTLTGPTSIRGQLNATNGSQSNFTASVNTSATYLVANYTALSNDGGNNLLINNTGTDRNVYIMSSSTNRITILKGSQGGYVGIATSTPTTALEVAGTTTTQNLAVTGTVNWWGNVWSSLANLVSSIWANISSSDIVAKFTGCSGSMYLGADGACHTDQTGGGGGGATTTINNASGPAFVFATSSDTNIGMTVTSGASTVTFTPSWIGTLANSRIASSSTWNTAYTERQQWDGGSTNLVPATGRASLNLTDTATLASTTWLKTVTADSPLSGSGTAGSHLVFTNPGYISANQSITLSGAVSGTGATAITTSYAGALPYSLGGTGVASWAKGDLLYASALNTPANLILGATGTVLMANNGVPTWTATTSLGLGGGSGETNTASNLGTGYGVYSTKVGVDLRFLSLTAGTGITMSTSSTNLTINSTAGTNYWGLGTGFLYPATSTDYIKASNFVSTSTLANLFPNMNKVVYVDPTTAGDFGTKMNTAYASLQSRGGEIHVMNGTTSAWTVPIVFGTDGKPVKMTCEPSSFLIYTPTTGTSTTFNTGMDVKGQYGMFGCDLKGPDVGVGGHTEGIRIGGTNGSPNITIEGNHILGFGTGIRTGANTWSIRFINNWIDFNERNIHVNSANNSGENFSFIGNNISDCSTVTKCVYFETNGSVASNWTDNVYDNTQLYFEDGNSNIMMSGGGFENPNEPTVGKYTYIVTSPGGYTNMTITGTQFSNGGSDLAHSPTPFILNGGNLVLNNITVQSFDSISSPSFVMNYGADAHLIINGYKENGIAIDVMSTSSATQILDGDASTFNGGLWSLGDIVLQASYSMAFLNGTGDATTYMYNNGATGVNQLLVTASTTVNGIIESTTGGFKFPDGTVQTTASTGSSGSSTVTLLVKNGFLQTSTSTDYIKAAYFVGTSTTATSTFPLLEVTSRFKLFTQVFNDLTAFATYIRGLISSSATGLTYTASTGDFAWTAGYAGMKTASSSNWELAYASTTAMTPTYLRGLFSNTTTGLTYTSSTGVTSLTAGYMIPTTGASTTWDTAYSGRLQWDGGNTNLVATTGRTSLGLGSMALEASTTFITNASTTANYVNRNNWTTIDNYPTACTGGQYVIGIGDTLTCGTPTGGTGEANTASNLGTGYGLFTSKVGVDLQFKSIIAGSGITISTTTTGLTINSTGGSQTPWASNINGSLYSLYNAGNISITSPSNDSSIPFSVYASTTNPVIATIENSVGDSALNLRTTAGYGAANINLFSTAPEYGGFTGWVNDNLAWKIGRAGDSNGVSIFTLDGSTKAAQFTDKQDTLLYGKLGIGTNTFYPTSLIQIASSTNSYLQFVFQNNSNGNAASADVVVNNDRGTDSVWYTDLGINSSGYNQAAYNIGAAGDSYLYSSDGAFAFGTGSTTNSLAKLLFHTGGTTIDKERMVFDWKGYVKLFLPNTASSGNVNKSTELTDPWGIPSITSAAMNATYSDDLTRILEWDTSAGGTIYLRNGGFAKANQLYNGTTAQSITVTTMVGPSTFCKGAITYQGYHYALTATSTLVVIKRATATDTVDMSVYGSWATTTISGVALPTTSFLIGVAANTFYIATSTTGIQLYTLNASTNTLTSSGGMTISGANLLLTNSRVNENGIYAGFGSAPYTRKYTLTGGGTSNNLGVGVAVPSTTGPDIFATPYSLYGLYGNSTTYLTKIIGW